MLTNRRLLAGIAIGSALLVATPLGNADAATHRHHSRPLHPVRVTTTTSTTSSSTVRTTTTTTKPSTTTTVKTTTTTTTAKPSTGTGGNCANTPSACGYPDATNTGVRDTSSLKKIPQEITSGPGWHWDTRGWVEIDGEGTVFNGYDIDTEVSVTASNVTISNVLIHDSNATAANSDFGVAVRHAKNTTIQDSTIYGSMNANRLMVAIKNIYGDETGTRALRNNIHGVATGIQLDNGLVESNYIHDMGFASGDHINGFTSNAGGSLLTIRHNTIFNQIDQTDAISLFEDFGTQYNRIIDDNLVAGGGWTIYGGQNAGGAKTHDIQITNNKFSTKFFPNGGGFGPIAAWSDGNNNVLSGNMWIDGPNSGKAVS